MEVLFDTLFRGYWLNFHMGGGYNYIITNETFALSTINRPECIPFASLKNYPLAWVKKSYTESSTTDLAWVYHFKFFI